MTNYAKDRDRSKDYGKDRERDRHSGAVLDSKSSGRDPTPDRRSHSREKVVDNRKKRAGDSQDKKDGQDTREKRRDFFPHPARAFFDAAPAANEADRADD